MDLSGQWWAAAADEELRRRFPDPGLDARGWTPIVVPGHWRENSGFAGHPGPLFYRRQFDASASADSARRQWLVLDGVLYAADVWLDGVYAGATEGYFFPHCFDITEAFAKTDSHVLALEVSCPEPRRADAPHHALTGLLGDHETVGPTSPGGIWQAVRVEETGAVRVTRLRVLCDEATPERGRLSFRAVLDSARAGPAEIVTTIGDRAAHRQTITLGDGENRVAWRVPVDEPDLWWPRSLGPQPLHDVTVAVEVDGEASHTRRLRTGFRQVRFDDFICTVNGERLFLKGAATPPRRSLAAASSHVEADVERAAECGLDLLRVQGHVAHPALYDAADRAGMLLWQDLPLWGLHARGVRRQATGQAREAVDLLGHHPSVALWCGHDRPDQRGAEAAFAARMAGRHVPRWNRTVLDTSVARALERADGTRSVIPHSGVLPNAAGRGTDLDLSLGGRSADVDGITRLIAVFPRLGRFVSGIAPGDTEAARRHIEALRRLKYRPTGGFALDGFGDTGPNVRAIAEACAPVIVVADLPAESHTPGTEAALAVHVVNDRRDPIPDGEVTATVRWAGGGAEWRWAGAVPADACVRAGTLTFTVPDREGPLRIDIAFRAGEACAINSYLSRIAARRVADMCAAGRG